MKSRNVFKPRAVKTLCPPHFPSQAKSTCRFVSDDSAKAGTIIRSYICIQIATHGVLIIIKGCA